ncbi:MAG: class SAM-dependent methyltransferase [Actinomycetia bacterium]|nr:class SAM-dependent methyltransferase [Actinomycetes bacterium]
MTVDPRWYESFFETEEWLLMATTRDPERAERETAFVASHLEPGARVLDLACGTGRISIPLAEQGFDIAGLDVSNRVLEVARAAAPELDFRQGDMRELPWGDGSFDAVINMWTAFGYFDTQAEDERALAEVARVLRSGGVFILDTANQAALLRGLQHQGWSELANGTLLLEKRIHDIVTGRSQAYWTFLKDGKKRELAFDHRLYTVAEYGELLQRAGFGERQVFGGHGTTELTWDEFRVQIVARKDR